MKNKSDSSMAYSFSRYTIKRDYLLINSISNRDNLYFPVYHRNYFSLNIRCLFTSIYFLTSIYQHQ